MSLSFGRRIVLGTVAVTAAACAGVFATATTASSAVHRGAPRVTSAPNHKVSHSSSSNWSGYAVTGGGRYTSVSASWVQPAVNCSVTPTGWSSFWVGLDGDTTNTTGTRLGRTTTSPLP